MPGLEGDETMSNSLREGRFFLNLPLLVALLFVFTVSGCLPPPQPTAKLGSIRLTVSLAEQEFNSSALIDDVKKIRVNLSRKGDKLTKDAVADFVTGTVDITIGELYAGIWQVLVSAVNESDVILFQGSGTVTVESGKAVPLSIILSAGPGTLIVSCDVSKITGIEGATDGRLYIYKGSATSSYDICPLLRDGDYIRGMTSLPQGTYQIKIAVPNISDSKYESVFYSIHIKTGETTEIRINADGSIVVSVLIDTPPPTPQGLIAVYDSAGKTVELTWQEVSVDDLAGYYVYFSDSEGWMARATDTPLALPTFTHNIAKVPFYGGRIAYAVSSCDLGGNESIWSEIAYVYQQQ